jgi:hypothetical protein
VTIGGAVNSGGVDAAALRDANLQLAHHAKAEADAAYASEFKCRVATGALFFGLFFAFCCVVSWFNWPAMDENAAQATTTLDGYRGLVCVSPISSNVGGMTDNCNLITTANGTSAAPQRLDDGSCCVLPENYRPFYFARTYPDAAFIFTFQELHSAFVAFAVFGCVEALLVVTFPLHHVVTQGRLLTPLAVRLRVIHLGALVVSHAAALAAAWAAFALEKELVRGPECTVTTAGGTTPSSSYTMEDLGFVIPKDGRLIEGVGYTAAPVVLGVTLWVFRSIAGTGAAVQREADVPTAVPASIGDDNDATEALLVSAPPSSLTQRS